MRFKKIMPLVLALLMLLSVFAGCTVKKVQDGKISALVNGAEQLDDLVGDLEDIDLGDLEDMDEDEIRDKLDSAGGILSGILGGAQSEAKDEPGSADNSAADAPAAGDKPANAPSAGNSAATERPVENAPEDNAPVDEAPEDVAIPEPAPEPEVEVSEYTLRICARDGAFPLSYVDENGEPAGIDVELIKLVCEVMGWDYEIVFFPSPEFREIASLVLMSGEFDVAIGGITEDYVSYGMWGDCLFTDTIYYNEETGRGYSIAVAWEDTYDMLVELLQYATYEGYLEDILNYYSELSGEYFTPAYII